MPPPTPGEMAANFSRHNLVNGFVGFLFAVTGPLAIILAVGTKGGLDEDAIMSWIFGGYGIGGVLSILFSIRYRQPLALAWTIPGAVLMGPALDHLAFSDIVGAYFATGALIAVLGLTGWIRVVMAAIPMPIVMGMVAGVFLPLGLNIITAFGEAVWIASAMVAAFVAISLMPRMARVFPPVLGALIVGALVIAAGDGAGFDRPLALAIAVPTIYMPTLSLQALFELVIPLTVTVVGIQNAQGFAILRQAGYRPPENMLTLACGVGTFFFGAVGSVPACVTGPVNGILNTSGPVAHRYIGGVVFGVLILLFGLFAPVTTRLGLALPFAFIGMLGGLALLRVLQDAFTTAFKGAFPLGALVAFMVTVSDITILNIGAAFWGLAFGYATAWLLEREDFRRMREASVVD